MKRIATTLLALPLLVGGCAAGTKDTQCLILNYDDFGPQAAAWELIGYDSYQWDTQCYEEDDYPYYIKVIVYRGSLEEAKHRFPVVQGKLVPPYVQTGAQDYRFVEAGAAIAYLERTISNQEQWAADEERKSPSTRPSNVFQDMRLVNRLRATRDAIRSRFG